MEAETYFLQTKSGGQRKVSMPRAPQGPAQFHARWLARESPKDELDHHKLSLQAMWQRSSLGFFTVLPSAWAPHPKKFPYLVSTYVSLDNSFLSVRHEPNLGPWKGVPLPVMPLLSSALFRLWEG